MRPISGRRGSALVPILALVTLLAVFASQVMNVTLQNAQASGGAADALRLQKVAEGAFLRLKACLDSGWDLDPAGYAGACRRCAAQLDAAASAASPYAFQATCPDDPSRAIQITASTRPLRAG